VKGGRKGRGSEMEGPTYKGRKVKEGRGRVPPVITVPPDLGVLE